MHLPTLLFLPLITPILAHANFNFSFIGLETYTNRFTPLNIDAGGISLLWDYQEGNNVTAWSPNNTYTNVTISFAADNLIFDRNVIYSWQLEPGPSSVVWDPKNIPNQVPEGQLLPSGQVYFYQAELFNDESPGEGLFVRSERMYIEGTGRASGAVGAVKPAMGWVGFVAVRDHGIG